ncbi:MAG: helix-turn-helix transcriptional regulator [Actinobacteria bacterium]|nr:helix-turn-helix transcriptional regulator [Actinomycetota bacterium]
MAMPSASLRLLKTRFGANLRRERLKAGLTQEELSFRTGLHRTEVGLLERGLRSPRLATTVLLAYGLGITPGSLIDGIGSPLDESDGDSERKPG